MCLIDQYIVRSWPGFQLTPRTRFLMRIKLTIDDFGN